MIGVIKEICIFIIIAQAVLFFVPGKVYAKYVRILVGIIMILRMTEPIFSVVLDEEKQQEIRSRIQRMEDTIDAQSEKLSVGENEMEIYESLEQELRNRLVQCEGDYEVVDVQFSEEVYSGAEYSGNEEIIITVSGKSASADGEIRIEPVQLGRKEETDLKEEDLKSMYSDCIGVDADRIRVILAR